MSRPRFLADHDLNENLVHGLWRREPTIEFSRAREFGLEATADAQILGYAAAANWIVVSHDVNTMRAAAYGRIANRLPMAGLLLVHQRSRLAPTIEDLLLIWFGSEAEEWTNQVHFLPL
jgi:hypothetical protein